MAAGFHDAWTALSELVRDALRKASWDSLDVLGTMSDLPEHQLDMEFEQICDNLILLSEDLEDLRHLVRAADFARCVKKHRLAKVHTFEMAPGQRRRQPRKKGRERRPKMTMRPS